MRQLISFTLATSFLLFYAASADAGCIRCGIDKLACEGDSKFSVISQCGEPTYSEDIGTDTYGAARRGNVDIAERKIEKLYYDCGNSDFVKILTIRNGKIASITDGERGTGPNRCQ